MSSSEDYLDSLLANAIQQNNENAKAVESGKKVVSRELMETDDIAALIANMNNDSHQYEVSSEEAGDDSIDELLDENLEDMDAAPGYNLFEKRNTMPGNGESIKQSINNAMRGNTEENNGTSQDAASKGKASIRDSLDANHLEPNHSARPKKSRSVQNTEVNSNGRTNTLGTSGYDDNGSDDEDEFEDIEAMLAQAEREGNEAAAREGLMGGSVRQSGMDVTELIDEMEDTDAALKDINNSLKHSDENEYLGNLLENGKNQRGDSDIDFMKAEDAENLAEESGKKKKKKKEKGKKGKKNKRANSMSENADQDSEKLDLEEGDKKGRASFFGKLFGKKNKQESPEEDFEEDSQEIDDIMSLFGEEDSKTKPSKKQNKSVGLADNADDAAGNDADHAGADSGSNADGIDNAADTDHAAASKTGADGTDNAATPETGADGSEGAGAGTDGTGSAEGTISDGSGEISGNEGAEGTPLDDINLGDSAGTEGASGNDSSEDSSEEEDEDSGKKKKKLPGFLQKLFNALTEEVEDEEDTSEKGEIKLSDENLAILDAADAEEENKGKKGKKPKKEKKAKEKKPKKAKPKKPKKAKPVDPKEKETKKIPKKYIMRTFTLAFSIMIVILLICLYLPNLLVLKDARDAYYQKNYKEAFLSMYGKDLNESDQLIYDRSKAIILLDRKYEAYENYQIMSMPVQALDALLQGLERYELLSAQGEELGITEELNEIRTKILDALGSQFGLSEQDALDILSYDSLDYTNCLEAVVNGTEFIKAEDAVRAEYGLAPKNEDGSDAASEDINNSGETEGQTDPGDMEDLLPEEEQYLNQTENQSGEDAGISGENGAAGENGTADAAAPDALDNGSTGQSNSSAASAQSNGEEVGIQIDSDAF